MLLFSNNQAHLLAFVISEIKVLQLPELYETIEITFDYKMAKLKLNMIDLLPFWFYKNEKIQHHR